MNVLAAKCRVVHSGFSLDAELDLPLEGVTALFGPSGSGKSSLLRIIAGLDRVAGNQVMLGGEVWQDDSKGVFMPPHRRSIGFVFQDTQLFPHLSVDANIAYGMKRAGRRAPRHGIGQIVDILDLGALMDRRPSTLSGGERQRVASHYRPWISSEKTKFCLSSNGLPMKLGRPFYMSVMRSMRCCGWHRLWC